MNISLNIALSVFEKYCQHLVEAAIRMTSLSVDEYFYLDKTPAKSSQRRILDAKLDELDSDGLEVVGGTADAILKIKQRLE